MYILLDKEIYRDCHDIVVICVLAAYPINMQRPPKCISFYQNWMNVLGLVIYASTLYPRYFGTQMPTVFKGSILGSVSQCFMFPKGLPKPLIVQVVRSTDFVSKVAQILDPLCQKQPKGRRTLDPKRANDILPKSVEE